MDISYANGKKFRDSIFKILLWEIGISMYRCMSRNYFYMHSVHGMGKNPCMLFPLTAATLLFYCFLLKYFQILQCSAYPRLIKEDVFSVVNGINLLKSCWTSGCHNNGWLPCTQGYRRIFPSAHIFIMSFSKWHALHCFLQPFYCASEIFAAFPSDMLKYNKLHVWSRIWSIEFNMWFRSF